MNIICDHWPCCVILKQSSNTQPNGIESNKIDWRRQIICELKYSKIWLMIAKHEHFLSVLLFVFNGIWTSKVICNGNGWEQWSGENDSWKYLPMHWNNIQIEKEKNIQYFCIFHIYSQASSSSTTPNSVVDLVDRHLGPLYPYYWTAVRAVLVRQARDLLVCTFHGDLSRFERDFLSPAAKLIEIIKCESYNLSVSKTKENQHFL